jgi:sterol 14-demethylase
MGLLATILDRFCEQCSTQSTWVLLGAGWAALIVVTVLINVLRQLLFKNPNEPPVVFHWFPLIGSTVTYGIDPYKFFFSCREKVIIALRYRSLVL